MSRTIVSAVVVATLALGSLAPSSAAEGAVTCQLAGNGHVSPGVTAVPQDFDVTFQLEVACDAADEGLRTGLLTGSGGGFGGCGFSLLSGTAEMAWAGGQVSSMSWASEAAARTIHVDGEFTSGPYANRHMHVVGFIGASDPSRCAGEGVTEVTFTEAGVILPSS